MQRLIIIITSIKNYNTCLTRPNCYNTHDREGLPKACMFLHIALGILANIIKYMYITDNLYDRSTAITSINEGGYAFPE